ncbi:ankyrin repeat domain-containing protein [Wolbachia endosymbiont of Cantharis cryptica]|uniref:ankyrin repeat domain-containing protein n=1 Tax=Wolbachia endosymbiont of Cantharis cryptica TaxID=3066132 RepID=UPI00376EE469
MTDNLTYEKIKEIVTQNPKITAEEFGKELKKENINIKEISKDHYTLLGYAVNSKGPNITNDRAIFLQIIKLLADLKTQDNTDQFKYVRTGLSEAIMTKQADVVKVLLGSDKFNEEEKFNALLCAVVQGYVQEVKLLLGHVNNKNMREALKVAISKEQTAQIKEITQVLLNFITQKTLEVEGNRAEFSKSNGNVGSGSVATPNSTSNGNVGNKPAPPTSTEKTNIATPSSNNKGFADGQFRLPNTQDTKHKESTKDFYTSLTKGVVGVVITGLFIAAAVMVPSVAGAVVCGIVAALVATGTGLHIKDSTLPYREMEANRVEAYKKEALTPPV